jgi:hypothetical protein
MPLTRSRDLNSAPKLTEEEQKARAKARRKFEAILEDAADEGEAVLITVLKDLGEKDFGNGGVQGYLIRLIVLTGDHADHVEDELPTYKRGFTNRIGKAGVGATLVSRLGRYGERNAIGLEDDQDGDVELAEKALAKHGDPFEASRDRQNGTSITEEVDAAKRSIKEKAAAKTQAEQDGEPPF